MLATTVNRQKVYVILLKLFLMAKTFPSHFNLCKLLAFRYSVAWYPIYRIPAGKFGAAFLTYHSLGHFVHRSASSDSIGGGASIVSPVVGLQSYNAQVSWYLFLITF